MFVDNYSYIDLCEKLIGKTVSFKSDCEFFPNFHIVGVVISIKIANNNEFIITIIHNGKQYDIGSRMKNLTFEIMS